MFNKTQADSIAKHLRDMAAIFEGSFKSSATNVVQAEEHTGSKRGRKPGAVSDELRCGHINAKDLRCKNRATQGKVCGKHLTQ